MRAAAGVLAAAVAHAAAAGGETGAHAPAGVVETLTSDFPPALAAPGRKATVVLRATFVAGGVYADRQVVETQVHAGTFDADERERLGQAALRAFNALSQWRFRASPGAALPEPGSPIDVRVQFVTMPETKGRD